MGQTNYLKILWTVLYLCFAGISCFATAESLHMSWNSIPEIVCWIIAIGFFLIASFGTSMIADSFNRNKFIKNRNLMLFGGIFIVLIFWIALLIPTNTHTFLYRNVAENTLSNDLQITRKYLTNLENYRANALSLDEIISKKESDVHRALGDVKGELNNEGKFGFGPAAFDKMKDVQLLIGIKPLSKPTHALTRSQIDALYNDYATRVEKALEDWKITTTKEYVNKSEREEKQVRSDAKKEREAIDAISKDFKAGSLNLYDSNDMSEVNKVLENAYVCIKNHKDLAKIAKEDLPRYTSEKPETLVKHTISVAGLWGDILSGKAMNMGDVILYVIISILLDASAFVFFYLAKK